MAKTKNEAIADAAGILDEGFKAIALTGDVISKGVQGLLDKIAEDGVSDETEALLESAKESMGKAKIAVDAVVALFPATPAVPVADPAPDAGSLPPSGVSA